MTNKDIKKSSYYVWFLGAQEAKGLRGEEYVKPIVRHLIQKEKDVEPIKVTLQISHKGIKIIQNVLTKNGNNPGDIVKHFIPHNAVTCVVQESPPNDDIVSCILLIYNPITKCPVHVHCYRCDSVETASILRAQLKTLIDRPDNQQKFNEIECRLQAKGLLSNNKKNKSFNSSASDSTRESESSGSSSDRGFVNNDNRISNLYDSLAAELREKLNGERGPILLPPRDYDTVHRTRGNLTAIELRRCRTTNIVGGTSTSPVGSSNGSSGIGSEDPLDYPLNKTRTKSATDLRQHTNNNPNHINNNNQQQFRRSHNNIQPPADTRYNNIPSHDKSSSDEEEEDDDWGERPVTQQHRHHQQQQQQQAPTTPTWTPQRVSTTDMSLPRPRRVPSFSTPIIAEDPPIVHHNRIRNVAENRQRSPSPLSPRERFRDAKEKFHALERERLDELQAQLERRRQETAAANVAAILTSNRIPRQDPIVAGRYRAVPTKIEDEDDDDELPLPLPQQQISGSRTRRSMYENIEDERRRNSHELAKEFKRKSYHHPEPSHPIGYQELSDKERFPGLDRDTARLHHHFDSSAARYRHSYAEPIADYKHHHRRLAPSHSNAASSVNSSSNRMALHPY